MCYRRFEYKQSAKQSSGAESFMVVISGPLITFICFIIAAIFRSPWPIVAIIPLSILAFNFFHKRSLNQGNRVREKRRKMHIKNALSAEVTGDISQLKESIRRAKMYGELPQKLKLLENSLLD